MDRLDSLGVKTIKKGSWILLCSARIARAGIYRAVILGQVQEAVCVSKGVGSEECDRWAVTLGMAINMSGTDLPRFHFFILFFQKKYGLSGATMIGISWWQKLLKSFPITSAKIRLNRWPTNYGFGKDFLDSNHSGLRGPFSVLSATVFYGSYFYVNLNLCATCKNLKFIVMYDPEKAHYIAVTGIIVKDGPFDEAQGKKFLLTKRAGTEKAFPNKWTVPGGKLEVKDYKNRPKDTSEHWYNIFEYVLEREIMEETGLSVKNIGYLTNMVFIRPDNVPAVIISLYADYDGGEVKLCSALTEHVWVTLEEAKNYDLIEGIYEELEMLDAKLKVGQSGRWQKQTNNKLTDDLQRYG